jgi:deoxycytidine triphosphate deaminase
MRKRALIIISITVLLFVIIITIFQQFNRKISPKETNETATQHTIKTKAEISADKYISSLNTDFTIKSATTIYEEGDFAVIEIEQTDGKWTIRGPAITKRGEVIIPPNLDYSQETISKFEVPDNVISSFKDEGSSNG